MDGDGLCEKNYKKNSISCTAPWLEKNPDYEKAEHKLFQFCFLRKKKKKKTNHHAMQFESWFQSWAREAQTLALTDKIYNYLIIDACFLVLFLVLSKPWWQRWSGNGGIMIGNTVLCNALNLSLEVTRAIGAACELFLHSIKKKRPIFNTLAAN